MIHHRRISIPFDVCYLWVLGEKIIHDGEDEVLHLRIREVEHHLCAATSLYRLTLRSLYYPVGMLLI